MLRFLLAACGVLSFSLLGCSAALATAKNRTPGDSSPRTVWLHIHTDRAVRLERAAPGETAWHVVCSSPCDHLVSDDAVFRITGDDVLASFPFRIRAAPSAERVSLDVDAPSKTIHYLGIAGTVSGGVVATGALLFAFGEYMQGFGAGLGNLSCGLASRPCPSAPVAPNYTPALTVAAVAGLVTLAGIVVTVTHPRTSVDGPSVEPTEAPYLPGDPHYAPMLNEQDASPTASLAGPALWLPVLGGTF